MTTLSIESLNVGLPRKEHFFGKEVLTGICKQPVNGSVNLRTLGFEGDGVADGKHHGGQDKAVCVYSLEHYPYWEKTLGIQMPVAAFGENLTVSHMHEDDICIGDVFRLGSALVQVSQPRQPCRTLAARYGNIDGAAELFAQANARHPGLKVLYMSGYTDVAVTRDALQEGASFIQKPFAVQALATKVREVLDRD